MERAQPYSLKTYHEGQKRFIEAASARRLFSSFRASPIPGPAGEELAMDFAVGGPADAEIGAGGDQRHPRTGGLHGLSLPTGLFWSLGLAQSVLDSSRGAGACPQPFGFAWMRTHYRGQR